MRSINENRQSTGHVALFYPKRFYANPQTMETNPYQHDNDEAEIRRITKRAQAEILDLQDALIERGVVVTMLPGEPQCPDCIFSGNWVSTLPNGTACLFPMQAPNRRAERTPHLVKAISRHYEIAQDYSSEEDNGRFLEATGSLVLDHINKVAYSTLSKRTDESLAREWCEKNGYTPVIFETAFEDGRPVYHTDLVMYIGTGYAVVSFEVMTKGAEAVRKSLEENGLDIIEISRDQMNAMCGNALEVIGYEGKRYVAMSRSAYEALSDAQRKRLLSHIEGIIHADVPTIEYYGGGSVRCLILEYF